MCSSSGRVDRRRRRGRHMRINNKETREPGAGIRCDSTAYRFCSFAVSPVGPGKPGEQESNKPTPWAEAKKIPDRTISIRDSPLHPQNQHQTHRCPRSRLLLLQAGLLTRGLSSGRVFPTPMVSDMLRPLSPLTAAGPSPVYTGFPVRFLRTPEALPFHITSDHAFLPPCSFRAAQPVMPELPGYFLDLSLDVQVGLPQGFQGPLIILPQSARRGLQQLVDDVVQGVGIKQTGRCSAGCERRARGSG
jgi:hypothetical protein